FHFEPTVQKPGTGSNGDATPREGKAGTRRVVTQRLHDRASKRPRHARRHSARSLLSGSSDRGLFVLSRSVRLATGRAAAANAKPMAVTRSVTRRRARPAIPSPLPPRGRVPAVDRSTPPPPPPWSARFPGCL